jgi:hypothetical protein
LLTSTPWLESYVRLNTQLPPSCTCSHPPTTVPRDWSDEPIFTTYPSEKTHGSVLVPAPLIFTSALTNSVTLTPDVADAEDGTTLTLRTL